MIAIFELIPLELVLSIVGCAVTIAILIADLREHRQRTNTIVIAILVVVLLSIGVAAYQAHRHEIQVDDASIRAEDLVDSNTNGKTFDEIVLALTPFGFEDAVLREAVHILLERGTIRSRATSFLDAQGNSHSVFLYSP